MPTETQAVIEQLVQQVRKSAKYRSVSPDLIRRLLQQELAMGKRRKDALKGTKNKLHQIAGAYFGGKVRYEAWLADLTAAVQTGDITIVQSACRRVMAHHASTRERLDILSSFYATTLADLPPLRSVLDVACGFNPLAIPWMPLSGEATYYALDLYQDMMVFLERFFELVGIQGVVQACDILTTLPPVQVDLALALKVLPVLEQLDKAAGLAFLRALQADYILVSFPAQSLGGRDKQMVKNYEARFRDLIQAEPWGVKRFEFATELAFLIRK